MEQEQNKEIMRESSLEYVFEQDTEINLFLSNILNNKWKSHLDLIVKTLPELEGIRNNSGSFSKEEMYYLIKGVVFNFRNRYVDIIKKAEESVMVELTKITEAIKPLEDLMGEAKHYKYLIMPTIYPICPFDKNRKLFFFSITKAITDNKADFPKLSSIALHEISHFIFFDQIDKIPNNLSDIAIHHLKEVLTPVLLNHPEILRYREDKYICGNDESIKYQVEVGGEIMSIFDYVNREFLKDPTPEGYPTFLHWLICLFEKIQKEVIERDEFFKKNGRAVFTEPALKAEFTEPIKI